jgi:hypothetical protein
VRVGLVFPTGDRLWPGEISPLAATYGRFRQIQIGGCALKVCFCTRAGSRRSLKRGSSLSAV